jgi:hypothetical protein
MTLTTQAQTCITISSRFSIATYLCLDTMWDTFPGRLYSSFEETTVSRCGTVTTRYRSCGLCSGIAALFDQTLMIAPQLCNAARTWDDVDTEQCFVCRHNSFVLRNLPERVIMPARMWLCVSNTLLSLSYHICIPWTPIGLL